MLLSKYLNDMTTRKNELGCRSIFKTNCLKYFLVTLLALTSYFFEKKYVKAQ